LLQVFEPFDALENFLKFPLPPFLFDSAEDCVLELVGNRCGSGLEFAGDHALR
jgi:hypothetical protein